MSKENGKEGRREKREHLKPGNSTWGNHTCSMIRFGAVRNDLCFLIPYEPSWIWGSPKTKIVLYTRRHSISLRRRNLKRLETHRPIKNQRLTIRRRTQRRRITLIKPILWSTQNGVWVHLVWKRGVRVVQRGKDGCPSASCDLPLRYGRCRGRRYLGIRGRVCG